MELKQVYHELVNVNEKVVIVEAYVPDKYVEGFPGLICLKQGQCHAEDFGSVSWDIPPLPCLCESAIIRLAIKMLDEVAAKLEKEIKANVR